MKQLSFTLLFLLLIPFSAVADKADQAQVISGFSNGAQCIAAVRVRKIDGREATVQPMGFYIEPGTHTLSGSAITDNSTCKTLTQQGSRVRIDPIEAEFEAGKTYFLGYDHKSTNRDEWKLVIWKVEDSK